MKYLLIMIAMLTIAGPASARFSRAAHMETHTRLMEHIHAHHAHPTYGTTMRNYI